MGLSLPRQLPSFPGVMKWTIAPQLCPLAHQIWNFPLLVFVSKQGFVKV